ncbi:MAG: DM13 domain-containing protein [Rhodobacteraceae bacterium]|nr:DM13 domain-containing protein [Paracoccaceae bacterium]
MRILLLLFSHLAVGGIGFALGIYLLPILTAPPAPDAAALEAARADAAFSAEFTRDLRGSDRLHWGEGTVSVSSSQVVHEGRLAPGPDYKLYLTPEFVEHEDEFDPIKDQALLVGDVKSFDGFIVDVPPGTDVTAYTTVVVWCESFGEFITSAEYN